MWLKRLLRVARAEGVKCRLLLLDRGFYSVAVIRYLQAARCAFLMPVIRRGRKPANGKPATGTRALAAWKKSGWSAHTLKTTKATKYGKTATVQICVSCGNFAGKWGRHGRRTFVYAFWGFQPGSTRWIRETYRTRFGIENQLSPDERGPHSDMHQESPVASVLLRLGDDPAKRLGMVSSDNTFRTTRPTFDTAPGTAAIPRSSSQPSTGRRIRPRNHSIHGTATTTATTACDAVEASGQELGTTEIGRCLHPKAWRRHRRSARGRRLR